MTTDGIFLVIMCIFATIIVTVEFLLEKIGKEKSQILDYLKETTDNSEKKTKKIIDRNIKKIDNQHLFVHNGYLYIVHYTQVTVYRASDLMDGNYDILDDIIFRTGSIYQIGGC